MSENSCMLEKYVPPNYTSQNLQTKITVAQYCFQISKILRQSLITQGVNMVLKFYVQHVTTPNVRPPTQKDKN